MQVDFSSIEDHVAEGVELNKRVSVYNQRSLELVRLLSAILEAKTSSDPDWQRVPATAQKGRPAQRTSPGNFSRSHLYALSKKPHPESLTDDPSSPDFRPLVRLRKLGSAVTLYSRRDLAAYINSCLPAQ